MSIAIAAALLGVASAVQALQITSLSPQGEVAQVRQVVAKFDASAVNFGDPKAPAPLALSCSDAQSTQGAGRWISDREWAFEFERDLPPGVRCTVTVKPGFKSASGALLTGAGSYQFNSGGPFVRAIRPGTWQHGIDEEQFFALQLNGPATTQSLQAHMWCTASDLGERIPIRLLEGRDRAALLQALGWAKAAEQAPLQYPTFACNRRLSPAAQVQVVYGKGIATPSGVPNTVEKRFDFEVRQPFEANFACERENAQAACLPIRPLRLQFNAPVTRKQAAAIRLKSAKDSLKPTLDKNEAGADDDEVVNAISFTGTLPEQTQFTLELPKDFKDASGRALRNAASFPLKVATAAVPPLAKFSAAPFGIVERFAEPDAGPLLPVTLRNVEAALKVQAGKVSDLKPQSDAEIIAWFRKVQGYDTFSVARKAAARDSKTPLPRVLPEGDKNNVQTRMLSLLAGQPGVKTLDLPKPASNDPRPFEVVGIPLSPGFHVVEIASQKLGASLLDEQYGEGRTMYVRTSALVTNLGVHFKLGRENALAWVTSLDKGQPVAGAAVRVSDCRGKELATGTTDAQGIAHIKGLSPEPPTCSDEGDYRNAYFVSARAKAADGVQDMAFTWSDWNRGVEPWRFNLPTSSDAQPDQQAHTIFDRTLLRAGETVSMKHIVRTQTSKGFGLPASLPATLVITHLGSGQQYTQPLTWRSTPTGGRSAESQFQLPPAAKLGVYQVELRGKSSEPSFASGEFRVEEFRLPVLEGRIASAERKPLVKAQSVPVDVQVNYVAGGAAVNLPVRVSALVRPLALAYADYDEFSFQPPRGSAEQTSSEGEEESTASQDQRVVADKLPLTLDRNGAGRVAIVDLPKDDQRPRELLLEASYADPNGEVQTLRGSSTLWPAGVVAGIKAESWVSASQQARFQALALGLDGKPAVGVPLEVRAVARI
ncbi:MAG TPA: MG2 domain-containing protein, partial [Burkholderiaceae bacterium]